MSSQLIFYFASTLNMIMLLFQQLTNNLYRQLSDMTQQLSSVTATAVIAYKVTLAHVTLYCSSAASVLDLAQLRNSKLVNVLLNSLSSVAPRLFKSNVRPLPPEPLTSSLHEVNMNMVLVFGVIVALHLTKLAVRALFKSRRTVTSIQKCRMLDASMDTDACIDVEDVPCLPAAPIESRRNSLDKPNPASTGLVQQQIATHLRQLADLVVQLDLGSQQSSSSGLLKTIFPGQQASFIPPPPPPPPPLPADDQEIIKPRKQFNSPQGIPSQKLADLMSEIKNFQSNRSLKKIEKVKKIEQGTNSLDVAEKHHQEIYNLLKNSNYFRKMAEIRQNDEEILGINWKKAKKQ